MNNIGYTIQHLSVIRTDHIFYPLTLKQNRTSENIDGGCCIFAFQMSAPRRGGVSTLCGGGQRFGKDLPQPQPSHHPIWHWNWLGGRRWSSEGKVSLI